MRKLIMQQDNSLNRLAQLRVLVVDDHPFIVRTITMLLKGAGVSDITTAFGGIEAGEILQTSAKPFDLIVCDLNMPDQDGLVFLRTYCANLAKQPSVILISGEDDSILNSANTLCEELSLNVLGYVKKPVTALVFKELLSRVLMPPKERRGNCTNTSSFTAEDLLTALDSDGLQAWFQPQIFTNDGRVHGFEALARLHHPSMGMIWPDVFIPLAEQCGLIKRITECVIKQAIKQLADWNSLDNQLCMSINLSAQALDDLDFPDRVEQICYQHKIRCSQITIELTESALAKNQTVMLDILTRFRLKKFNLSIDDFGTGYSSLQILRKLPFNELKVDKSFVMDAMNDRINKCIMENNIRLGNDLELFTVAEGVEDEATMLHLKAIKCSIAQGFYIAKPLAPNDADQWLRTALTQRLLEA